MADGLITPVGLAGGAQSAPCGGRMMPQPRTRAADCRRLMMSGRTWHGCWRAARSRPRPPAQAARVRGRADAGRPRRPPQGVRPRGCGPRPGRALRPAERPDRPHRGRPPAPRPRALLPDRRPRRPDPDHHPQGPLRAGVRGAGPGPTPEPTRRAPACGWRHWCRLPGWRVAWPPAVRARCWSPPGAWAPWRDRRRRRSRPGRPWSSCRSSPQRRRGRPAAGERPDQRADRRSDALRRLQVFAGPPAGHRRRRAAGGGGAVRRPMSSPAAWSGSRTGCGSPRG